MDRYQRLKYVNLTKEILKIFRKSVKVVFLSLKYSILLISTVLQKLKITKEKFWMFGRSRNGRLSRIEEAANYEKFRGNYQVTWKYETMNKLFFKIETQQRPENSRINSKFLRKSQLTICITVLWKLTKFQNSIICYNFEHFNRQQGILC